MRRLTLALVAALLAGSAQAQQAQKCTATTPCKQTVTESAAALPSGTAPNGVIVCAALSNAAPIALGGSTVTATTGFPVGPSPAPLYCTSWSTTNFNNIYIISGTNTTDVVYFYAP